MSNVVHGVGMKICTRCKIEKPESEFGRFGPTAGKKRGGVMARCKVCRLKQKQSAYQSDPAKYGPKRHKLNLKKYGLSPEQYALMLQGQNGVCAICMSVCRTGNRLCVDHIHGRFPVAVRGLLCHTCNQAIGLLYERSELFDRAKSYLQKGGE